jgi:hypothetical protein
MNLTNTMKEPSMTRTIVLTGARGGQGTTTVAAALAVFCAGHTPTVLRSADPVAVAALIGVPMPLGDEWIDVCPNLTLSPDAAIGPQPTAEGIVVIDGGRTPTGPFDDPQEPLSGPVTTGGTVERFAVLRGPCYVALATLLTTGGRFDGVILVTETGRSLSDCDVTDVLGIPVVATVRADPSVARTIDAGLLLSRLHRHAEFRGLRPLAQRPDPLTIHPSTTDTDLHLSIGDRSATKMACRARPVSRPVSTVCNRDLRAVASVEHRQAQPRCRRLLRR